MRADYSIFIGKTFGQLTLSEITGETNSRREVIVKATCACGGSWTGPFPRLKYGNTKSCGCLQPRVARATGASNITHGMSCSPTYKAHRAMMRRCYEPTNIGYRLYGGAGITVCDRWKGVENFKNFLADMGERPPGTTLDRYPDNKGNYEQCNCRWATAAEQAANTSTNRWLTANGETLIMAEWARRLGCRPTIILDRLKAGVPETEAVTRPVARRKSTNLVEI